MQFALYGPVMLRRLQPAKSCMTLVFFVQLPAHTLMVGPEAHAMSKMSTVPFSQGLNVEGQPI